MHLSVPPLFFLAGLTADQGGGDSASSSGSPRAVYAPRFQLAAHERCLLRFQLACSLGDGQAAQRDGGGGSWLGWRDISIKRAPCSGAGEAAPEDPAHPEAATIRVGVQQLAAPAVARTLRIYCPAAGSGAPSQAAATHCVDLASLPGSEGLLAAGPLLAFASSSSGVRAAVERGRLVLACAAPEAGATHRCLLAAYSCAGSAGGATAAGGGAAGGCSAGSGGGCGAGSGSGGGCPREVWELFLHGLPTMRLAASVGATATASCLLPQPPAGRSTSGQQQPLDLGWRGCSGGELQVSTGSGRSTAAAAGGSGGTRLVLAYEPAAVGRHELLLSAVDGGSGGMAGASTSGQEGGAPVPAGRPRQVDLWLVQLDSGSTHISRTFEVEVPAGQSLSKKVRYSSPYAEPRRFAARSLHPAALRLAPRWQRAAGGVLLEDGEEASIRMAFLAAGAMGSCCGGGGGISDGQGRACEALAVLESAAVGSAAWRVEEVFRVLLTVV